MGPCKVTLELDKSFGFNLSEHTHGRAQRIIT
jgi:hypothetical protein